MSIIKRNKHTIKGMIYTLLVFLAAFFIHSNIQFVTTFFADTNDSFYHAKMAEVIMQHGVLQEFPWLFFTTINETFVNHHFLFHILLIPFIVIGNLFESWNLIGTSGLVFGAKFAVVIAIAGCTTLFYRLLKEEKIEFKWLWVLFLLAVPYDFYFRMHMIRVQSFSLLFMLLGLLLLWRKHYKSLGALCFLFVWLYGGFFFLPIFVAMYFVVHAIQKREYLWWPLIFAFGGMFLGFVLNFYFPKNFEFLRQQIFDTGLGYEINVGGEWKPYDTWYLFSMAALTFLLQFAAIAWSHIKGLKQNAKSITLFLISIFFLILMFKSKRFVEYWPIFAVLSSAYMLKDWLKTIKLDIPKVVGFVLTPVTLFIAWVVLSKKINIMQSISTDIVQLPPFVQGLLVLLAMCTTVATILYVVHRGKSKKLHLGQTVVELLLASLIVFLPVYIDGNISKVKRDITHNTTEINRTEEIMECVKSHANEGDKVMTDDWDVFPMFFFFNMKTYYMVGLDPVFMQNYDADLYEEFKNITIGRDKEDLPRKIKEDFQAQFVVIDKHHGAFKTNIQNFPDGFMELCSNPDWTAYKVR